jgi:hypothetical protein
MIIAVTDNLNKTLVALSPAHNLRMIGMYEQKTLYRCGTHFLTNYNLSLLTLIYGDTYTEFFYTFGPRTSFVNIAQCITKRVKKVLSNHWFPAWRP